MSSQFFVEVIQEDIGEQRKEWTTLRGPHLRCLDAVPDQHPRPQVADYQGEEVLIKARKRFNIRYPARSNGPNSPRSKTEISRH